MQLLLYKLEEKKKKDPSVNLDRAGARMCYTIFLRQLRALVKIASFTESPMENQTRLVYMLPNAKIKEEGERNEKKKK